MKKLKFWLADRGMRQGNFAKNAGVSETWLSSILSGKMKCGYYVAHRIEAATNGDVTVADIMGDGE